VVFTLRKVVLDFDQGATIRTDPALLDLQVTYMVA
jgi:hypothetical protein